MRKKRNFNPLKETKSLLFYIFLFMIVFMATGLMVNAKGIYEEPGSVSLTPNFAEPIKCHTFVGNDGNITIIYSILSGSQQNMIVDVYSLEGLRISQKIIPVPGRTWGGTVYLGNDGYRYITTGNDDENAFYIQKYSGDWSLIGTASIGYDESFTAEAFHGGNSDMAMVGKYLIVHAARGRQDGHQSNTTFFIDTTNMKPTYITGEFGFSHVSHSFNQFVRVYQDQMILADQGDGYPRSLYLQNYKMTSDENGLQQERDKALVLMEMWGSIGQNYTGVTFDGFELGENYHVAVGTSIPHDRFSSVEDFENYDGANNIFIVLVNKDIKSSELKWLTSYPDASNIKIKNLNLLKVNDDKFILLYGIHENDIAIKTCYMIIDSTGNILKKGEIEKPFYCTSAPDIYQDTLVWSHYVESELGNFMVLTRWNISTDELSVKNLDIGQKSKISDVTIGYYDTLLVGKKYNLRATISSSVFAEEFPTAPVVWTSSDSNILEVLEDESILDDDVWNNSYKETFTTVKAKSSGTVTINMYIGDKNCSKKIKVTTPVKALTLSKNSLSLKTGQSYQLQVSGNNGNPTSWKSSNSKIVKVNSKGEVTGLKKGQAKITVSSLGKKASLIVKVSSKKWTPPSTKITEAERTDASQLSLRWNSKSGISGYEIYLSYQKKKGYKKVKIISNAKTVTYNIKNIRKKTCYVKIRTYKKYGSKKLYSKYSKVVVCKK